MTGSQLHNTHSPVWCMSCTMRVKRLINNLKLSRETGWTGFVSPKKEWNKTLAFKTGALLPPVDTNVTQRAALTTGRVIVTRCGGGLGESLMGATIFFVSYVNQKQCRDATCALQGATCNCQMDDATCCTLPLRCTAGGRTPCRHDKRRLTDVAIKKSNNLQLSPPAGGAEGRGSTCVRQVPFPAVTYQTQANRRVGRPVGLTFTEQSLTVGRSPSIDCGLTVNQGFHRLN